MKSILLSIIIVVPLFAQAQSRASHIKDLHREIDKLSAKVTQLEAERARSSNIEAQMKSSNVYFSTRDSLRLVQLRRKQAESRARIDQLTMDIIKISRQLEDPNKRYALAKKMRQTKLDQNTYYQKTNLDSVQAPEVISARSIDLSAIKLVRQGKSLDQARLITIETLSDKQVLTFYQNLDKEDRYELYDIADEIVVSDKVKLVDARRSAIYFYLFTK
ncbi:MAG: hypothetical protein K9N29_04705 [Candidatus Marinimicrobia bacterium]|nr:hypothetical protein [Candidatus Neomarinimicrobiota bacterium]